ncbi:MAG: hypothetical protein WA946_09610 [Nitrospirota bacterium]
MKASVHVSTSTMLAAALYVYSGSVPMAASCLASGVLIDLDHVVDFHLFSGERFSIANFFSWCNECRWQRITLIFHSYELFGILCAVAYYLDNAVLRGIVWGAGLHLLLDQLANSRTVRLSPWFYLLGYRIAMGFRRDKLQLS